MCVCDRAPDGTCLLASSADCKLRLFNLPTELYSGPVETQLPDMVRPLSVTSSSVWVCSAESSADPGSWGGSVRLLLVPSHVLLAT